jgi:hypothetical protein
MLIGLSLQGMAQSETTDKFHEDHEDAFTLFFYKNTLRMLNVQDNKEFEELIRDIDKMKFLRIEKEKYSFDNSKLKSLADQYRKESFEDLMDMRSQGANLNVFIKEKDKITTGLVILMEDEENFSILDIKGAVPLSRIAELVSKLQSADSFNWN